MMVAARRASLSSDNYSYLLPSQISWAVHKGHTVCGKLALQSIRKDNVPHAAVFPFTVMPSVLYVVLHVLFSELLFINSLFVLLQVRWGHLVITVDRPSVRLSVFPSVCL